MSPSGGGWPRLLFGYAVWDPQGQPAQLEEEKGYMDVADCIQLQEKIQTIEQTASTKVAGAVDATKDAVGLGGKAAVGGAGGAPRMVLIGPPGAGTYLVFFSFTPRTSSASIPPPFCLSCIYRGVGAHSVMSHGEYGAKLTYKRQGHPGAQHLQQVLHLPPRDGRHAPLAGRAPDRARQGGQEDHGPGRVGVG